MNPVMLIWLTLLLLAFGAWMAVRLWFGARGPDWRLSNFSVIRAIRLVIVLLLFGSVAFSGVISVLGVIVALLAAVTLVEAVSERRAARRRSMCTLLALMVGHGKQLDPSALVAGLPDNDTVGRASAKLFELLGRGVPLAKAIRQSPRALPREAIAYVSAGETMQAEAAALKELSHGDQSNLTAVWRTYIDRLCYLAAVLVTLSVVMTFLMIKIIPEFEKIFLEFDLGLPKLTLLAVSISKFTVNYLGVPLLLLAIVSLLAAIVIAACYLSDVRVFGWLGDRLFRGRRTADVLRILAVSTEHRQPLTTVFERLAQVYPSQMLRRQMAPAAAAIAAGGDWRDSLRDARFVSPAEQSLLKTAEKAGNLPWALRTIAARQEKRAVYRLAAAVQVLYPILIMLLGAVVAFFVVSLFVPLVKLVEGLAG
jgi:type II secretory pathway component PulF